MYTYKVTFERSANEDLRSLDLANNGRNRTRMEIALETLEDHRRLHSSGVNQRPVPDQMKYKIALLFHFMRNFHSEMRLPEEKPSSKYEKSYGVSGEEVGEEGDEEDDHNPEEGDCSESENGDNSVMAVSGKTQPIKMFNKEQLQFDKSFAEKVNNNCREKRPDKM